MFFHRFEDNATRSFNPLISTAQNHLIEGTYLYYNLNCKPAGTGSEPHYHPNELLVFCVRGRINALVGKERYVISPGTFIVVPPNARHSFKATEEGDCGYLYIKDQTWTLMGIAEDEVVPEKGKTLEETWDLADQGIRPSGGKDKSKSQAIIEGLAPCFYKFLDSLDEPIGQCERRITVTGTRTAFSLCEFPGPFEETSKASAHEQFIYMFEGSLNATVGSESRGVGHGDIIEIPKGAAYALRTGGGVRYAMARSRTALEAMVDAGNA